MYQNIWDDKLMFLSKSVNLKTEKILKMEPRVFSFELQGGFEAWARGCLPTVPLNIATVPGKLHILMALCYQVKSCEGSDPFSQISSLC